jgi:hypothetical protein
MNVTVVSSAELTCNTPAAPMDADGLYDVRLIDAYHQQTKGMSAYTCVNN